ncbi:MAG TPA: sugar phosphate isomerase/epimerase [Bauldia sp.]|nr:sugar phosphate isomerase/epimerase [Bauldia sp.]
MKPSRLCFALYSSRNFWPLEPQLGVLKEMGYDSVEPWWPAYGDDPKAFRKMVDAAGLAAPVAHMSVAGIVNETERFIDIAGTIGATLMVCPWLPPDERGTTADDWKRLGAAIAKAGAKAREAGRKVLWHNHDFEYSRLPDGSRPIDHLLAAAGDEVGFEIDCAWVVRGGADVAAELTRYGRRIDAIQVKDTAPPGTRAEEGWVATGDGIVPWKEIWPLFARTNSDLIIMEHDNPADWQKFARRSLDYARKMQAAD